ncbi:hypothetical protein, partial [Streptomyces sp. NPDC059900]|uniref:hypothetical protein n=1 Tax=Streptomyces sp. NPDC059900 TaxID=3155816 RepID=UPI003D018EB2
MTRFARAASRARGPAAALPAIMLALLITLLGPSALCGGQPCVPSGTVAAAPASASAPSTPHADDRAGSEPYAQNAEPGLSPVTARSHRDVIGERHVPPLSAVGTSHGT